MFRADVPASESPIVSIVVPTKNSARTLERCLESLRGQNRAIELIVVDNYSTDETFDIARKYADIALQAGPERSAQRNAGLAVAAGEFVFFADSDMIFPEKLVAQCLIAISGQAAVAVPEISVGSGFWARCKALERSFYASDSNVSAARFFRRSALDLQHGYDEEMHAGEDWDLSMRVTAGAPLVFADVSIIHDEGELNIVDLFRKKMYYGRNLHVFLCKHGAAARAKLSPLRSALFSNAGTLIRQPILGFGVVVMKATEALGGTIGILLGLALSSWSRKS